jgi:hypothetical protein
MANDFMHANQITLAEILGAIVGVVAGSILVSCVADGVRNFRRARRARPAGRKRQRVQFRLAVRVGNIILQGGSVYTMTVDQSERFQLVVVDKFGNVIPGATFANVVINGDTTLAAANGVATDASLFDLVPTGKVGTDSLSFSANVTVGSAAAVPLSGTLSVAIGAGAPASLSANDLGPTPAATAAPAAS